MPVPNTMSDLATLAGSNFPTGSEVIGNSLDDYIRAHGAIIRSTNALASATIASASTVDVAGASGESVIITGTTTITSLGTGFLGCVRELRFNAALTLTHSTNLQLPAASSYTTTAGDILTFRCIGSGQWVCTAAQSPRATTAGLDVNGTLTATDMVMGGQPVGYRRIPGRNITANDTLVLTDVGRAVVKLGTSNVQLNLVPQTSVAWSEGDTILIMNFGTAGNLSIARGTGVTLVWMDGSGVIVDANRTIGVTGYATIRRMGLVNQWALMGGAGVS